MAASVDETKGVPIRSVQHEWACFLFVERRDDDDRLYAQITFFCIEHLLEYFPQTLLSCGFLIWQLRSLDGLCDEVAEQLKTALVQKFIHDDDLSLCGFTYSSFLYMENR